MKSKIYKVMGAALAVVLVFSLGLTFLPTNTPGGPESAEAGTLSWSTMGVPSITGNVIVGNNEDLGPVAISPNFATDKTVFAVVNDVTTPAAPLVYKSLDSGHTWIPATAAVGTDAMAAIALLVSPEYATDSTVYVVVQNPLGGTLLGSSTGIVYRSTNGGSSWGQLGEVTLGTDEVITSMDVSPDGSGMLVIGIADKVAATVPATATSCVQLWGLGGILSWTQYGPAAAVDISAVKFSPNYAIDSTILTVSSLANTQPTLRTIVGGTWDQLPATNIGASAPVGDVELSNVDGAANDLLKASIAVPQDYNATMATTMRVYVSIVGEAAVAATTSNVYRITGTSTGVAIGTTSLATGNVRLYPIDFRGTFSEGTLLGGLYGAAAAAADVYRTTNPTDAGTSVNWYSVTGASNKPSGGALATANVTAFVAMSNDYTNDSTVIVGTQGVNSAFGISTNGAVSFNETGLIEGGNANLVSLMDVKLSPDYVNDNTMFLSSNYGGLGANNTQVWVTTNGGSYWDRCFSANFTTPYGAIGLSNDFATNSTVYVGDRTGTAIYYSGNNGQSWSARTCGVAIQTIAAPDATNVYVGTSAAGGQVAKSTNSGWTWPANLTKATGCTGPIVSIEVEESSLVAGGSAGTVRRSDDGTTWTKVSTTLSGVGDTWIAFNGGTVYAGDGGINTGQVYRSIDGGGWTPLSMTLTAANNAWDIDDVGGLSLAPDGTLYLLDTTVYAAAAVGAAGKDAVWRCINPTATEPTPGTTWQRMGGWTSTAGDDALNLTAVSAGSNLVVILGITAGAATADVMKGYTDTLSAGIPAPTLLSPANGSALSTTYAVFGVDALPNVTAYEVWWSTDPTLNSRVTALNIAAPSTQVGATVTEGYTVYWMARATAPFVSPWSEVWSFDTALTVAVDAPTLLSPGTTAGSTTNVDTAPVLNWTAYKYATGYELQLAKDANMSDFIANLTGASALGNTTAWKCDSTLDYSTTYFWRVRAVKGTAATYSDWSNVIGFTTMAEPVEQEPTVIVQGTEPTPVPDTSTPAYIWAIIAIGAVLVIVVVVLIVRTRRA